MIYSIKNDKRLIHRTFSGLLRAYPEITVNATSEALKESKLVKDFVQVKSTLVKVKET